MILPGYEDAVEEDRKLINAGWGNRIGNDYTINGRTYRDEGGTGTSFPVAGAGVVSLDRGPHVCLVKFARYHGPTEAALREISLDPSTGDRQCARNRALAIAREMRTTWSIG